MRSRLSLTFVLLFVAFTIRANGDDGQLIYSASSDFHRVAWSPDDVHVAVARGKEKIEIVRLSDGEIVRSLTLPVGSQSLLGFSPDGRLLAVSTGRTGAEIFIASLQDDQLRSLPGERGLQPLQMRFSGEKGERLTALGGSGTLVQWNVASGAISERWKATPFAPDVGAALLVADDLMLTLNDSKSPPRVWKVTGSEFRQIGGNPVTGGPPGTKVAMPELTRQVEARSVSPNLKTIAIAVRVFEKGGDEEPTRWLEFRDVPSGDIKFVGPITIGLWRTDVAPRESFKMETGGVSVLEYSPDAKLIASGHGASFGFHWSTAAGIRTWKDSDFTVRVWDIEARRERARFKGHTKGVQSVHFTSGGKRVYSAGRDGTIRLWELEEELLVPVE